MKAWIAVDLGQTGESGHGSGVHVEVWRKSRKQKNGPGKPQRNGRAPISL